MHTCPAEVLFGAYLLGHDDKASLAGMGVPRAIEQHGGWWAPLVDLALGRAAMVGTGDNQSCVTLNLRIDLTGVFPPAGEEVFAVGTLVSAEGSLRMVSCEVRTAGGRAIAYAVGRFMLVPGTKPSALPARERPRLEVASLPELLRVRRDDLGDRFTLAVQPWDEMANPSSIVHGGVQAALLAAGMQVAATSEDDDPVRMLDLTVAYHRPLEVCTPELVVRSTVERRGRSICSLRAGLVDGAGLSFAGAHATFDLRGD